ncbi:helix-turn-helix transcriptional regulator [Lentzea sp. DG1S-22]|uniref:helix-turn-helix domain-containing protein n=1 Tax=Lentzea sp. DG1S-22 TaxID=3108822 RepID=UPI002E781F6F|nr:helix-turn-helix transcriptional regulator [Lentzea sp. DG1S-22]WVH78314.1 helix-turn-helix transcriptional regulator [Lentzea sp. DG1S-22]
MPKRISTARGREFGAGLRAAIKGTGLTSRALADITGWDEAKLSNVVNGRGGATQVEIAALLGACRVKSTEASHLLALYPETHIRGWWQQHGMYAPVQARTIAENLRLAKALTSWHTHMVPPLLQTADYIREALRASSTTPADELQERVMAQLGMQESLRRGVRCTFLIHELALHLPVAGAEVHTGQLLHLLHMASRPNITIRIVPTAHGAHAGLTGPFTHLTFAKHEPLVITETENSTLFTEAADAVKGYEEVVRALGEISLSEADSTELVLHLCDASRDAERQ